MTIAPEHWVSYILIKWNWQLHLYHIGFWGFPELNMDFQYGTDEGTYLIHNSS